MIEFLQSNSSQQISQHRSTQAKAILFFTIGYEQADSTSFLALLHSHHINLVVDVRQVPLSRKKGFSKNRLRSLLNDSGIDYLHVQALGAPTAIRNRLRDNGCWQEYERGYKKVLAKRTDEVLALADLATTQRICLLCFERKPEECHRSLIAEEMEKCINEVSLRVEHIRY